MIEMRSFTIGRNFGLFGSKVICGIASTVSAVVVGHVVPVEAYSVITFVLTTSMFMSLIFVSPLGHLLNNCVYNADQNGTLAAKLGLILWVSVICAMLSYVLVVTIGVSISGLDPLAIGFSLAVFFLSRNAFNQLTSIENMIGSWKLYAITLPVAQILGVGISYGLTSTLGMPTFWLIGMSVANLLAIMVLQAYSKHLPSLKRQLLDASKEMRLSTIDRSFLASTLVWGLVTWLMFNAYRLWFVGSTDQAWAGSVLYALAIVSSAIALFEGALGAILHPLFFGQKIKSRRAEDQFGWLVRCVCLFLLIGSSAILVFSEVLFKFFVSEKYQGGYSFLSILLFIEIGFFACRILSWRLLLEGRNKILLYGYFLILVCCLLIPFYGFNRGVNINWLVVSLIACGAGSIFLTCIGRMSSFFEVVGIWMFLGIIAVFSPTGIVGAMLIALVGLIYGFFRAEDILRFFVSKGI